MTDDILWVIQTDLFQNNDRDRILDTLDKFDVSYQEISLSSDRILSPEINHTGKIITNGSVMLSSIAKERGWKPGAFFNDNFSYDIWYPHFKNYLLNKNAVFTTIREANPTINEFFLRPLKDDKSFNGRITSLSDFKEWKKNIVDNDLKPDTKILYSPLKIIGQEYRHFIIDKKVISSSRYKLGDKASTSNQVDNSIIEFAEKMAKIWQPAEAFVLDTYVSGDEMGIVEIGCICNAGFYEADVQKIIMTLNNFS